MNISFKRIKKTADVSLSDHSRKWKNVGASKHVINKYENTFCLNAARCYEKKSLKCVIKLVLQTCTEQLI